MLDSLKMKLKNIGAKARMGEGGNLVSRGSKTHLVTSIGTPKLKAGMNSIAKWKQSSKKVALNKKLQSYLFFYLRE